MPLTRDFVLDAETDKILRDEAKRAGLSMSAALRLMIRKIKSGHVKLL
jgi:hypothetical protein